MLVICRLILMPVLKHNGFATCDSKSIQAVSHVSETGKAGLVCPTKRAILLFLQMDLAKPLCSVSDAGFDFQVILLLYHCLVNRTRIMYNNIACAMS